jgi:hypothetical protein
MHASLNYGFAQGKLATLAAQHLNIVGRDEATLEEGGEEGHAQRVTALDLTLHPSCHSRQH